MIKPISPDDAQILKAAVIPEEVIAAVNTLILEKIGVGRSFMIKQKDIIALATKLMQENGKEIEKGAFFDRGWLNIEGVYAEVGWKVKYDSPAWDESYDAYFEFMKAPK